MIPKAYDFILAESREGLPVMSVVQAPFAIRHNPSASQPIHRSSLHHHPSISLQGSIRLKNRVYQRKDDEPSSKRIHQQRFLRSAKQSGEVATLETSCQTLS